VTKAIEKAPTKLEIEAKQVENAVALVLAWPVATQHDLDELGGGLRETTARLKFLEEERAALSRAPLDELELIRSERRGVESAYKKLKEAFSTRTVRYHQEQRAAEARARELAQTTQLQAHAAAQAGQGRTAQALQTQAYQAMSSAPPAMTTAGVHTRKDWRIEITDPAKVPREFCVPDPALVLERVRVQLGKASEVDPEIQRQIAWAWEAAGVRVILEEKAIGK
jgi:hypothetical protein